MNRAEAKRYACWCVAAMLRDVRAHAWPSQYPGAETEDVDSTDRAKVIAAAEELRAELERRGGRPIRAKGRKA